MHFARTTPDCIFLADRGGGEAWRTVTYAEALDRVRRLGEGLLQFGLSADRPLAILSGNDIEHGLLGLAAQYVGIPYAAISPAYSLVSTDYAKLSGIFALLTPGLVFAADGKPFAPAITAVAPADVPVVTVRNPVPGRNSVTYESLVATVPTGAADAAHERVGPDTIAKFLFTSGSTGSPKAVINTQRMMTANQEMVRDCFAYMRDEPPIVLDWAPWNHTAGGNKVFNMVLYNGGTLYIDDGRPTPDAIKKTVRNLHDVAPTWYFNVPKGYEELVPHLEADATLRRRFYSRLSMMMYAGAGLAQHTWDALERMAVQTTGERVLLVTGLGSTETAPFSMMCTVDQRVAGNIGLPARGIELKLVPVDGKLEARLKGPNVTPGYWRDAKLTADAFDEEGFYRLGDAFRFADPGERRQGLLFRRAHRRELQAEHRHVGERRGRACPPDRPSRRPCPRRRHHRPRPRLHRRAGRARHRRLPDAGDWPAGRCVGRSRAGRAGGAQGVRGEACRPRPYQHRLIDRGETNPDPARASVDRSRRGDRQGLAQPACRAEQSRRPRRGTLSRVAARHRGGLADPISAACAARRRGAPLRH